MRTVILGLMTDKEHQKFYGVDNEKSKHLIEERANRSKLVIWDSKPLYYFEVFRSESTKRQVHVLLEDATLLIFNRETSELITVILLNPEKLDFYMDYIDYGRSSIKSERKLSKCAKLNKKSNFRKTSGEIKISEEKLNKYLKLKNNIIEKGWHGELRNSINYYIVNSN